ncbi:MAG: acyl-CoA thioesterase [Elusimicrobia bacterium]|nr:acyl-CoA thioesterase [Elusimicrobiota bacterium]
MKVRIHYHHTDCGGVVYYGNYLEFLEEARTEALERLGVLVMELRNRGVQFVVYRQEIDYKHPAFYGDVLDVRAWVSAFSGVRTEFSYEIKNQSGRLVSKAKTVLVCVNAHLEPGAPPEEIAAKLAAAAQTAQTTGG